jgi:hypothetical protein
MHRQLRGVTRKRPLEDLASSMYDVSFFFGAVPKTSRLFGALGFDAARSNQRQVCGLAVGAACECRGACAVLSGTSLMMMMASQTQQNQFMMDLRSET